MIKPRVLIVDDSLSITRYVTELLEQAGYMVDTASDGEKGLKYIESHDLDVVLLDIEMPVMNGLEVLSRVNSQRRLYSVILFTCLSGTMNRAFGLNMGADDYISKPFEPGELIARVNAAVRTTNLKKDLLNANDAVMDAYQKLNDAQGRLIEKQKILTLAKMTAGVAHELNNPLGYIRSNLNTLSGYANVLSESAERTLRIASIINNKDTSGLHSAVEEFQKWTGKSKLEYIQQDISPMISEILEGIDRMSSFIRSLLIMDQAGCSMQTAPEDLNALLKKLLEHLRISLPPAVSLVSEFPDGPLVVYCNIGQFNIAVENILNNAADAVDSSGEIRVRVFRNDRWACIEVKDTGGGIPPEKISNIFEPFYTTKDSIKRIGLGLTVSQTIIHAHGGRIEVQSPAGSGTSVTIYLPLEEMA
ncbi:MAG: hybrid sensor histidine kinase/response regulator [Nitrospirae bacterium]|nr:hybrid sensor histidine kinase/response regulator [Nitrospirota bacterium]